MPVRIAVVTTSYPVSPGDPSGHFVEAEAHALAARGHGVTVFCPGRPAQPVRGSVRVLRLGGSSLFGWPGALEKLRRRPWSAAAGLLFIARVRQELRRHGPFDHVIAHWVLPAWPILLGFESPLEVVAHGSDVRLLLRLPAAWRRKVVTSLLEQGARFRFVSEELRDSLVEQVPELEPNSWVEPCGIVVAGVADRQHARRDLGVPLEATLVVIVGRLIPKKRVGAALNAALLIPGCSVAVVGDGPEERDLQGRYPEARFVGHVARDRALAWIAAADLLLSASREEGSPTVIREARALGVPVVAASAGDLEAWSRTDPGISLVH